MRGTLVVSSRGAADWSYSLPAPWNWLVWMKRRTMRAHYSHVIQPFASMSKCCNPVEARVVAVGDARTDPLVALVGEGA